MTKRTTNVPIAVSCRRWGAALVAVAVAGSLHPAMAQSTLRFVDGGGLVTDTAASAPAEVAPSVQPSHSELRFIDVKEGALSSPANTSAAVVVESARIASTLTLAPVKRETAAAPFQAQAMELRFLPEPVQVIPSVVTAPASQFAPPSYVPAGTELFTTAPQPSEFKPRIVTTLEHVPALAPQPIAARPVSSALEAAPGITPIGTELFAAALPRQWEVPALDYGTALRNAQPQPIINSAKPPAPIAMASRMPTAVTVKPAPLPSATELFSAVPQQAAPMQQIAPQVTPQIAAAPKAVEQPAKPQTVEAPVFKPQVVATSITAPIGTELFASAPVKTVSPPTASELDFARIPTPVKLPKPQFIPAAPVYATSPVVAATPVQQLVPTVVAPAATLPSVASVPPTVAAPSMSQVSVTQDPDQPNVYQFRFAATTNEAHTSLAQASEPAPIAISGAEPEGMLPEVGSLPCGCDPGPHGQFGCPYLPGQSGAHTICGVDCGRCGAPCCSTWSDSQCIPWSLFGPGEYVGPARPAHVDTYYLRVNDFITLTFIESRKKSAEHYRIGVGDTLQIEWLQGAANTEVPLNRDLLVQPDGTVTLPLIGEVNAAGKTINDFRDEVVKLYSKYQRDPQITVTPLSVNVAVQDVLKAVTSKSASSGQTQDLRVSPDGTIQAAGIGSVYVQGLTLDELQSELEARYTEAYGPGLQVSPQLTDRAVSYVFLGGEVKAPGRYTLEGPTTVMQAIALAGGWNIGGNVRQVVVFRRDENWCLKATKIDVRAPLYGNDPCPTNDVWLRENDLVLVPKSKILCATDLINLYFTRGVYAVFPISYVYDFSQNSGIVPIP